MSSPYFFGAAVGGFLLMTAVGVPALVALCSSIPLAKRRKTETPGFDLKRAYHRITSGGAGGSYDGIGHRAGDPLYH